MCTVLNRSRCHAGHGGFDASHFRKIFPCLSQRPISSLPIFLSALSSALHLSAAPFLGTDLELGTGVELRGRCRLESESDVQ